MVVRIHFTLPATASPRSVAFGTVLSRGEPLFLNRPRAITAPWANRQLATGIYPRQPTIALLRRDCRAFAEMLQASVDPQLVQFFLHAVLRQAATEGRKIDPVHLLILVKAGKHHGLGAGLRVALQLQALRANLLHHALHRRVDRGNRQVIRAEIMLEPRPL